MNKILSNLEELATALELEMAGAGERKAVKLERMLATVNDLWRKAYNLEVK
jgi:hypothetical protein